MQKSSRIVLKTKYVKLYGLKLKNNNNKFGGIIEMDDFFFNYFEKVINNNNVDNLTNKIYIYIKI